MLVSPKTVTLKSWIKFPMVLLVICSSMMSGVSMVMLKMVGELVASSDWRNYWITMTFMVLALGTSGAVQMHELNLAMKFYD